MGLFDFLSRGNKNEELEQLLKNLTPEQVQQALIQRLGGGLVVPDDNVQSYIDNGYNANNVVHSAVRYITRRASQIPLYVAKKNAEGEYEYLPNHWLNELLESPNDLMSGPEFIEQSLGFYLLTGNTYVYKMMPTTRENGNPIQLWNLPSQYIEIELSSNPISPAIKSYNLQTIGDVKFEPQNIIHLRTPNYNYDNGEWLYGLSPIKAALKTLNANNSGQTALAKLQQNLGAVGLLTKESGPAVDNTQVRALQRYINKNLMGAENKGAIRVLSQAYKYTSLALDAQELEIIKANQMTARELYAIYGLDSKLFNDPESTAYNNMTEARKGSYTEAIIPNLEAFAASFTNNLLAKEKGVCLKLDLSGIEVLRKDIATIVNALKDAYWIPTSEKQLMSGIDPDGVLPEYILPFGQSAGGSPIDEENMKRLNNVLSKYAKDRV